MFKKIALAASLFVVATSGIVADEFKNANKVLDIFSGQPVAAQEMQKIEQVNLQKENFNKLHKVIAPMAPGEAHTVSSPIGTITVYQNGADATHIKGTHKGAQFDSDGSSQIPFTGRNVGAQNGNKFIQFFSPKATIILANNYPASGIPAAEKAVLEAMAPGCTAGGVVKTIVVLAKPSGMEHTACFNKVLNLK